MYILFGGVLVKVSSLFLIRLFIFLFSNFKYFLHIVCNSPLSDMCFANIFFQSLDCLFILSTVSLKNRNFNFDEVH